MGISLRDQTIAQLREQIEQLQIALNTAEQRAATLDLRLSEVLVERDAALAVIKEHEFTARQIDAELEEYRDRLGTERDRLRSALARALVPLPSTYPDEQWLRAEIKAALEAR